MKCFFSFFILLAGTTATYGQQTSDSIVLNQLGFYPHGPKIAVVKGQDTAPAFYLIKEGSGDTAYKGTLSAVQRSANSATYTRIASFSAFTGQGSYRLYIPGTGFSYPFTIGNGVNGPAANAALKGFYFIRSNTPLEAAYAGQWQRPAGHPDTAVLVHASAVSAARPEGTVISTPGGWYDAGDYNKYIVNSGITMGTLLSAYEDFPAYFQKQNTQIPESYNQVPDILDETIYNLRWMLTMQDPKDGGVYHKCTNAAFDGMVMPGVTQLPRYVVQKGTAATLDFAAVTAQAARILQSFNQQLPGLADSCLKASLAAWQWAEKNPAVAYNQGENNKQFAPPITTGDYGDNSFSDEWFWAACELYASTKEDRYWPVIIKNNGDNFSLPAWSNVHLLGVYTLLRLQPKLPPHPKEMDVWKNKLLALANNYLQAMEGNAFKTVMGGSVKEFNWGSNSNAANQGIALINAYFLSKNKKFISAALSNLDYILGRNATGYSFVTGIGAHSTMHPHHRPSVADGIAAPVPGLLAGGPNPGMQDKCSYPHTEPETAYSDTDCSYASNEIAINWNAPLVYLAHAIEALQPVAGF